METEASALIPMKPKKKIMVASLVPTPEKEIGRASSSVMIGMTIRRKCNGISNPKEREMK